MFCSIHHRAVFLRLALELRCSVSYSVKWGHEAIFLLRSVGGLDARIKHVKQGTQAPLSTEAEWVRWALQEL